jgi:tetratricopeptide (TPR) repeat protein
LAPLIEAGNIPARAVHAAADLLNVQLHGNPGAPALGSSSSPEAYAAFQNAQALMKQSNDAGLEKAVESYKAALESDPGYATAYAQLALAYCRLYSLRGDPAAIDMARRNAEAGLRLDPQLIGGHLALSSVYSSKGQKQEALGEIGKALAIAPKDPKILFFQAQYYRRLNLWPDAERIYRRILEERPNYWLAYNDIGFVLNAQGRYQEALQAFRSATLAAPRSALAFNNVGGILLKLGDFRGAKQNFQQSLDLKPSDLAYSSMATVLRAQGRPAEALAFCLKAVDAKPSDDQNWMELGDCYEALPAHAGEARAAYLRGATELQPVLSMNPDDRDALIRLALYRLKTHQGDVAGLLRKAGNSGSGDLDSKVVEARVFELLGNRKQAITILGECFAKGLTIFEISFITDLQALRKDPAFRSIGAAGSDAPVR